MINNVLNVNLLICYTYKAKLKNSSTLLEVLSKMMIITSKFNLLLTLPTHKLFNELTHYIFSIVNFVPLLSRSCYIG